MIKPMITQIFQTVGATHNPELPPLISCQKHLDMNVVRKKMAHFQVFVVRVHDVELRGKRYLLVVDGHHNLAAALLSGKPIKWKEPPRKYQNIMKKYTTSELEHFLIQNVTDSPHFYVATGDVVGELL